jgi:hypothetical protein
MLILTLPEEKEHEWKQKDGIFEKMTMIRMRVHNFKCGQGNPFLL